MRSNYLFTSESVSEGHPDKVSDQISDAIVDLFLSKDPEARIACETLTTTQLVVLAGEIRGKGIMDEAGNWAPGVRDEVEATVRATVQELCGRLAAIAFCHCDKSNAASAAGTQAPVSQVWFSVLAVFDVAST